MNNIKNVIIVNFFTTLRLIGVFFIIPIYHNYGSIVTGIFLIFIYLTDKIDGTLARKLNAATFFGSLYDGLSDKLLNFVVLITLLDISKIAYIPLVIEILITIINMLKFKFNQNVKTAEVGRVKMVVFAITVILTFLLSNLMNESIYFILLYIPLTIASLTTLLKYAKDFFRNDKNMQHKIYKNRKNLYEKMFDNEFYEENKNSKASEMIKK